MNGGSNHGPLSGPGAVRDVTVADPAAGTNWTTTVPALVRWNVLSITFLYTPSADLALRRVNLVWSNAAGAKIGQFPMSTNMVASTVEQTTFANGSTTDAADVGVSVRTGLPLNLILIPGDVLRTIVTNIDAADAMTAIRIRVLEWIEV